MELLDNPNQITSTINRLLRKHDTFRFMVAWATARTPVFNLLKKYRDRIGESIVGLHFYQTDPKFIEEFLENENIKYYEQSPGVFHPKVYYFESSPDSWNLIVGSANFTMGGLRRNSEVCLHVSSRDPDSDSVRDSVLNKIDNTFQDACLYDEEKLDIYRKNRGVYNQGMRKIKGGGVRPSDTDDLLKMNWDAFYAWVSEGGRDTMDHRLVLLEFAREQFENGRSFGDIDDKARKIIGGYVWHREINGQNIDVRLFGNTNRWGFPTLINEKNTYVVKAVDAIPVSGNITKSVYMSSVGFFEQAYVNANTNSSLPGFTRLLAMKRPDWFICLTGANKDRIRMECNTHNNFYGIDRYDRYWDEIIIPAVESSWWQRWGERGPEDENQRKIWKGRVALLDAGLYSPK